MKPAFQLLTCLILASCSSVEKSDDGGLKAGDWSFKYCEWMPAHPEQDGKGFKFTVPKDSGEVDYLLTPHKEPLDGSLEVRLEVDAGDGVVFDHQTESSNTDTTNPAAASFIIYADDSTEFGRWWSNPGEIELAAGVKKTLKVTLEPAKWSSVQGKFGDESDASKKAFSRVLKDHGYIGLTFGGGFFRGHGFRVRNGPATIRVKTFKAQ